MATVAPIDFYFDLASPYAWYLSEPLQALADRHGRELRWHPVLLWAVLKQIGMPPPLENEVKKRYVVDDMYRSARFFGQPDFKLPTRFPVSSHLPARAYHALAVDDAPQARRFADAAFTAYFTRDADIGDADTVAGIGAAIGISKDRMHAAMTGEAAKDALRIANQTAAERGVWGSPFVFIDDQAYFGADRLPQIEAHLAGALRR